MKRVRIRVGGGAEGKLIYYSYIIFRGRGDPWLSDGEYGSGFAFLKRRDKVGFIPQLYALRDALIKLGDKGDQFEIRFYSTNNRLYHALLNWGSGYRDKRIIDLLNEVRSLSNRIGLLRVIASNPTKIEGWLKRVARRRFEELYKAVLDDAEVWVSRDEGGYVVYVLNNSDRRIPLEYFVRRELKASKDVEGVIVMRSSGSITRLLYHTTRRHDMKVIRILRSRDSGFVRMRMGTFRCLYLTKSPVEEVESRLLEVFSR